VSVLGQAEAYDRHTGRYGAELASAFVRFARVAPGMRALDVGCGPGALTVQLAAVVGGEKVSAVDPSESYARACRERVPGADVRVGAAETLPFQGDGFDAVLSQLVVQALDDAPRATREMVRVAAPGGVVAACVWDFRGGMPLLDAYWAAARAIDAAGAAAAAGDVANPWCTAEGLRRLWQQAGAEHVEVGQLSAAADYDGFDNAWFSFAAGVSASGAYCRTLDDERREALRAEFQRRLDVPDGPFRLSARAWAVRGSAPESRGSAHRG
jgi:SAM-dependent methyltransferase